MNDYEQLDDVRKLYADSTKELHDLAVDAAETEAAYQAAKCVRVLELRESGLPTTLIPLMIKGDPKVNKLMLKRDTAKALYESTQKAIDTYKLDARLLEARIQRDWNMSGGRL